MSKEILISHYLCCDSREETLKLLVFDFGNDGKGKHVDTCIIIEYRKVNMLLQSLDRGWIYIKYRIV